jgi:hypothetical protein
LNRCLNEHLAKELPFQYLTTLPGTLAKNWLGFYPQPFFQGNSFLAISKELIIGLGLG